MKHIALAALFLLPAVSLAAFDNNLSYGSTGPSVIELQEFLTREGVYTGPITGNFYALTRAGVVAYQAKEGIVPAAGFFGPLTRAKAQAAIAEELAADDEQSVQETGTTTAVSAPKPVYQPAAEPAHFLGGLTQPTNTPAMTPLAVDFGAVIPDGKDRIVAFVANQLVDANATTFSEGVSLKDVLMDGATNGGAERFKNTQGPGYMYRLRVAGAGTFSITVHTEDGQSLTREL
jgi:hypothetical protein